MTNKIEQIMARGCAAAIYPQAASSLPTPFDSLPKERQRKVLDAMRSALTALDAAGLAVLPKEATKDMTGESEGFADLWKEMSSRFDAEPS